MVLEFISAVRSEGPIGLVKRRVEAVRDEHTLRGTAEGYGFAAPYLIVFGMFMLYPLFLGLYMSFHDWNAFFPSESVFIGLENYRALIGDARFWQALWNTVYFVILTVPALIVVPLLLALGVNRNVKGQTTLRTIFFSPYILTVSIMAILWTELFSSRGLIRYVLSFVLEDPPRFLISQTWAMIAIAVATIWWVMAFNFVILLAARQNVSERLYEAAKLDGASTYRMMRDVTIPQMRNPLMFVVIITFVGSFQVFGQPYIMTSGGPDFSTHTIVMYLYTTGFQARDFGYAASVGYVLFLILIGVSLVNYYALGEGE